MAANRLLIARTDSRRGQRIDQSVSLFDELLAVRFPKMCAFDRFSTPRGLSIEAMQFTDNCMSTLVAKKKNTRIYIYTHTRVRFAPGRRGVNWIFRPASFGVTFHNACHIYLRVIPLLWRRRHTNRKRGQKTVGDFYPLCSANVIKFCGSSAPR